MKNSKKGAPRQSKTGLRKMLSASGIVAATVIIIISVLFCFTRTVFFGANIWNILDSAVVNVVCSAVIFLIFDARDVKQAFRLSAIVNTKMRGYIQDWDKVVQIMKRDTDERLLEIDGLDLSKYQPGIIAYALGSGVVEHPSYHKVLCTETDKMIARMEGLKDIYFNYMNPEVIELIDEMRKNWDATILTFSMIPDENSIATVIGGKNEKNIVNGIRQITNRVKKIDKILKKASNP